MSVTGQLLNKAAFVLLKLFWCLIVRSNSQASTSVCWRLTGCSASIHTVYFSSPFHHSHVLYVEYSSTWKLYSSFNGSQTSLLTAYPTIYWIYKPLGWNTVCFDQFQSQRNALTLQSSPIGWIRETWQAESATFTYFFSKYMIVL